MSSMQLSPNGQRSTDRLVGTGFFALLQHSGASLFLCGGAKALLQPANPG